MTAHGHVGGGEGVRLWVWRRGVSGYNGGRRSRDLSVRPPTRRRLSDRLLVYVDHA